MDKIVNVVTKYIDEDIMRRKYQQTFIHFTDTLYSKQLPITWDK